MTAIREPSLDWIESHAPADLPEERAYMVGWNMAVFGRPFDEAADILRSIHRANPVSLRAAFRGFQGGSVVAKR